MKYTKKVLANMPLCYSIAMLNADDQESFLIGVEKKGPCNRFTLSGTMIEAVNEGPGGVMTMLQSPFKKDQFLSTQEFYSPNCGGDDARIVSITKEKDGIWKVETLCDLPYVHRFGIVKNTNGKYFILACTIKSACEYKEDWRSPGKIYAAMLPEDLSVYNSSNQLKLTVLRDEQLKNHGFYTSPDQSFALVTTQEGVFRYTPPSSENGEWDICCILKKPVSDVTMVDFDKDGKAELLVFSEFHGEELSVYRIDEQGEYKQVYLHPESLPFLHAIWGGTICGEPCAIIGHRKGNRDLLRVYFDPQKGYAVETIDHDCGPANALAYSYEGQDYIVAANRETDEVALYLAEK